MMRNDLIAIVMGRNYASRLGMIRAAGLAGCRIVSIQTSRKITKINKIDACSKYVVKAVMSIEPDKKDLVDKILKFKNQNNKNILLPTDDYTASVIDQHLDLLEKYFLMPHIFHTPGRIVTLMNKDLQKKLARDSGMLVAEGWKAKFENGQYRIPSNIIYPCFVKPNESYKRPLKQLMKKCQNEVELTNHLKQVSKVSQNDMLIEQYIEIEKEYAVLGVSMENESVIPDIITMKSDYLGVTAIGEISNIDIIQGLKNNLQNFMKKTYLTGLFDIDLYESKGRIYFNELNVRLGASGYAVTKSQINLPELLINYLLSGSVKHIDETRNFKSLLFANEKTCLAKYTSNQWSFSEYSEAMRHTDFSFIRDGQDDVPFKYFKKEELKSRIKKCIRSFFRR